MEGMPLEPRVTGQSERLVKRSNTRISAKYSDRTASLQVAGPVMCFGHTRRSQQQHKLAPVDLSIYIWGNSSSIRWRVTLATKKLILDVL